MSFPAEVHPLPFEANILGRESTLHPVAIELADGILLVDTGTPRGVDAVIDALEDRGFSLDAVRMVLLTHQDGDHAGGLARILERSSPTVFVHERDAGAVDDREPPRAIRREERYPPARVDVEFTGQIVFNTLAGPARVLETPGHTPGHVSVYLEESRLLLAGDVMVAAANTLYPTGSDVAMDPDALQESIRELAELDIDRVLCYHGGLVEQGTERLDEISRTR